MDGGGPPAVLGASRVGPQGLHPLGFPSTKAIRGISAKVASGQGSQLTAITNIVTFKEYQRIHTSHKDLEVGDICLLKHSDKAPQYCHLCIVTEAKLREDGEV